ncbi:hypothetical protein AALA54_02445 [Oscillospiraceae bacterium 44-34]
MKHNRLAVALLTFMLLFSCPFVSASASVPGGDIAIPLATGRLEHKLPANLITPISQPISFEKGETIAYNCTYTPKSASMDFGYIDSNNVFHYLNCTSGSIEKSFELARAGQYTLAIRNNASYAVTVTGTVRY